MNEKAMVSAQMPSNIALIKYMGKVAGSDKNRPTNSSLSWTLSNLLSRVDIESVDSNYDEWSTLSEGEWLTTSLSDRGRKRFLAHFGFLKQKLNITGHYLVRSANNFPSDCGIASSASSFAALTQASYLLALSQNNKLDISLSKLADLSRVGSGSSIRSFYSPLVMWTSENVSTPLIPFNKLIHKVVVVDREKKAIGSSDAHERVTKSLLFDGRPARAEHRLVELLASFNSGDWRRSFEIVWAEFWDMHALFATSSPPFQYMSEGSLIVLAAAQSQWFKTGDGPLVTMDAGANVHLLYRENQMLASVQLQNELLSRMAERNLLATIIG